MLFVALLVAAAQQAFGQSEVQKRPLVLNGHSGNIVVYNIDGKVFVSLEELVQLGNGSLSFRGSEIVVALPNASQGATSDASIHSTGSELSREFMEAAIQNVADIQEWHKTLAQGLRRGIPGDGSGLFVFHDRAATSLRLATVAARNNSDQSALQLLTNNFKHLDTWTKEMIQQRRSLDTAKYSMSQDALDNDAQYQQIADCSRFLGTMLASGRYQDHGSCH
jgi:hypothetical protein